MHPKKSNTFPAERLAVGPDEAAQILGIGRSSIFKLMHDGILRGVKLGKRRLFTLKELEGLLARLSEEKGR